jgi:2-polyprenyl-6-methoxyphenol hydroxylase-like FAD-dependent oxidoreductase
MMEQIMTDPKQRHVLIAGGGIAGPVLALFLKKAGIACTVFEGHAAPADIGGGLTVAPNGMNVLDQVGLADAIVEAGSVVAEMVFVTHRGESIGRLPYGPPGRYGRPAVSLSRSRLQAIILAEVQRQGIPVEYGRRVRGFAEDGQGITVQFEDGSERRGSLLVGADGIHSRVRRLLMPEAPRPGYTGLVATGGFMPRSALPIAVPADAQAMTFCFGPGVFFGYAPGNRSDGEDGAYWWSALDRPTPLTPEERAALRGEAGIDALMQLGDGWSPQVRQILAASTRLIEPLDLYDVQGLPRWWQGRVVLIGDAAHAVSPHSGQGASMAIEDAIVLARQLRDQPHDLPAALAGFERQRRHRTERVIAFGRRSGDRKKRQGGLAMWLQRRLMALFLKYGRPPEWMYRHREAWQG